MLLRRILYWANYTVIRWQLLVAGLAFWGAWHFLKAYYEQEDEYVDSGLWKIMHEGFVPYIFWSLVILFGISVSTAIIAWIYFFFFGKKSKASLQIKFGEN